ncbi:hypothetical protein BDR03DRAFT_951912 [Suillus americanus]|nr:hypothetical protein BDR03DRAFT_951912 [Suillus americanus]
MQLLHYLSCRQKKSHVSTAASKGAAEIDDAKAAATARTVAKAKRIVCEDVRWNQINLKG